MVRGRINTHNCVTKMSKDLVELVGGGGIGHRILGIKMVVGYYLPDLLKEHVANTQNMIIRTQAKYTLGC